VKPAAMKPLGKQPAGQRPPTPATPVRQRHQMGAPGKKK